MDTTDEEIQREIATSMMGLFEKISNFIFTLIGKGDSVDVSESESKDGSKMSEIEKETNEVGVTRDDQPPYTSFNITNQEAYSRSESKIKGIKWVFPNDLNEDVGILNALNMNNFEVLESNRKNNDQMQILQFARFNNATNDLINCFVIQLLIQTGPEAEEQVYICVEYTSGGTINDPQNNKVLNAESYKDSQFKGVVLKRNAGNQYLLIPAVIGAKATENWITSERARVKKNQKPDTQREPESQRSPIKIADKGTYEMLSIFTKMYDMYTHGVEGLGKIAVARFPQTNIASLATDKQIATIRDQIDALVVQAEKIVVMEDIKVAQAANDILDMTHDFRNIAELDAFIESIYSNEFGFNPGFRTKLKKRLVGLLSMDGNINVENSHKLQKQNIEVLVETLHRYGIIFPDIPDEKFATRMQVFAEFIADLMNQPPPCRSNYQESGKQVTIGTFKTYAKVTKR